MNTQQLENPTLKEVVTTNSAVKEWLVNYVGVQKKPKDGNITVEMIVDVLSKEFPEFLMVIAEENFIRGYEQAMFDLENEPDELKGKKLNKRKK